ncbi:MAG: hypothetical protein ACRDWI_12420 [Jiangellaceae bacterium]
MIAGRGHGAARAQRRASLITLVVGMAMSVAGWAAAGSDGLVAGVAGTVVVIAFFWSGSIPVLVTRGAENAGLGMGVLLLTYSVRIALVLIALTVVGRADVVDERWLGATVIACALCWAVAHAALALRGGASGPDAAGEAGRADG